MYFIEDTRNQIGKHELKHQAFEAAGDKLIRCKLPVGDYALFPKISVDTKESMQEIAQNIGGSTQEHNRFRNELKLAREYGCQLFVLVENEDGIEELEQVQYWTNPRLAYSEKAINGPQLFRAMTTMQERYGVIFLFCRPSEAAGTIKVLLQGGGESDADGRLDKD